MQPAAASGSACSSAVLTAGMRLYRRRDVLRAASRRQLELRCAGKAAACSCSCSCPVPALSVPLLGGRSAACSSRRPALACTPWSTPCHTPPTPRPPAACACLRLQWAPGPLAGVFATATFEGQVGITSLSTCTAAGEADGFAIGQGGWRACWGLLGDLLGPARLGWLAGRDLLRWPACGCARTLCWAVLGRRPGRAGSKLHASTGQPHTSQSQRAAAALPRCRRHNRLQDQGPRLAQAPGGRHAGIWRQAGPVCQQQAAAGDGRGGGHRLSHYQPGGRCARAVQ